MPTNITELFSREERKNYVVINKDFYTEARVRSLALAAAAMLQWVDHARAKFSHSTAERYIESLYWDPSDPDNIIMGVFPNTLADLLERGQDPRDLNSIFLRKPKMTKTGELYRVIPIDDTSNDGSNSRSMRYISVGMPLTVSVMDILYLVNNRSPGIAGRSIMAKMSKFNKMSDKARSYKPVGKFIINKSTQKFRTIFPAASANSFVVDKPHKIWKHPGIRAALLSNQVTEWMSLNRERFVSPLFNREAGFGV